MSVVDALSLMIAFGTFTATLIIGILTLVNQDKKK